MNLLDNPTHYRLPWTRIHNAPDWWRAEVVATSFGPTGKPAKWVLRDGGSVLAKDGKWEYEPTPSERGAAFLERTRWDSAEEAAEAARRHFAK